MCARSCWFRVYVKRLFRSLPVLLDVERPLKLQMGVVVVVDELGDGLVVASSEYARGCGLGLDWVLLAYSYEIIHQGHLHFFS